MELKRLRLMDFFLLTGSMIPVLSPLLLAIRKSNAAA